MEFNDKEKHFCCANNQGPHICLFLAMLPVQVTLHKEARHGIIASFCSVMWLWNVMWET